MTETLLASPVSATLRGCRWFGGSTSSSSRSARSAMRTQRSATSQRDGKHWLGPIVRRGLISVMDVQIWIEEHVRSTFDRA